MEKINSVASSNVSWENSYRVLFFIQKRLFKSVFVGDFKRALAIQKLIIKSNSSRLLAIRYVTQICVNRKVPGVDGKSSFTFVERFELNEFLRLNVCNWFPQGLRSVSLLKNNKTFKVVRLSTISDRAWQFLIKSAIEPIHEALFHPRNLGFRSANTIFDAQKLIYLNILPNANGCQKKVLIVNFKSSLINYNSNFLLRKLIASRSIKVCLNRLLALRFPIFFPEELLLYNNCDLSALLANIILDGVELIHNSIRFGHFFILFLKPKDDEKIIIKKLYGKLLTRGLCLDNVNIQLFSSEDGFDFLGWNFKTLKNKMVYIIPSFLDYQKLLVRLKHVINNSNFGSIVKANKIYPIIKEWRLYHRFSSLLDVRFSLFLLKKRAFKVFCKESRQDFYSTKRLLDKCFYVLSDSDKIFYNREIIKSPYFGHLNFGFSFSKSQKFYFISSSKKKLKNNYFCFHCGMKSVFP